MPQALLYSQPWCPSEAAVALPWESGLCNRMAVAGDGISLKAAGDLLAELLPCGIQHCHEHSTPVPELPGARACPSHPVRHWDSHARAEQWVGAQYCTEAGGRCFPTGQNKLL